MSAGLIIVEKNLLVARILQKAIQNQSGLDGPHFSSYAEALTAIKEWDSPETILLLDANLGSRREGIELLRELRVHWQIRNPAIIFSLEPSEALTRFPENAFLFRNGHTF